MKRSVILCTVGLAMLTAAGCYNDDDEYYPYNPDNTSPPDDRGQTVDTQPVTIADVRPPPISGGTLLTTRDGRFAVAADPDRDRVSVYSFEEMSGNGVSTISLEPGDEPGRVVEDLTGRVHIALRRGGSVVTIDPADATVVARRPVCGSPRGLVHEPELDQLHVACESGELVTLAADPAVMGHRIRQLERDLRDVVLWDGALLVSRFRSAEVLRVSLDGSISGRSRMQAYQHPITSARFEPGVAWRMIALPAGVAMIHQRGLLEGIDVSPPAPSYYPGPGDCGRNVVHSAVSLLVPAPNPLDGPVVFNQGAGGLANVTLPVDIAVSADGLRMAVVGATSGTVAEVSIASAELGDDCGAPGTLDARYVGVQEPIAVAYAPDGSLIVQQRQPALLQFFGVVSGMPAGFVALGGRDVTDTGHGLFHGTANFANDRACASCHPEGRDDGRVWNLPPDGRRRTQSLAGGFGSFPLHWDGSLPDFSAFMEEVHTKRMGNQPQSPQRIDALASWVAEIPESAPRSDLDPEQVERGRQLYVDDVVGCNDCHAEAVLAAGSSHVVGTGGLFQVPSLLGVSARAPFMHDGCASTLRDRFGTCGGGDQHGKTSHLSAAQIDDLVVYLESL